MAQRAGTDTLQLFVHLARKAADFAIIKPIRNQALLGLFEALNGFALLVSQ